MPQVRMYGVMDSLTLGVPVLKKPTHRVYDGFTTTKGTDFRVRVTNSVNMSEAKFECDWKLQRCLMFNSQVQHKISTFKGSSPSPSVLTSRMARHILAEMMEIGWDKVDTIDETFQELTLKLHDTVGRKHSLLLNLNHQKEATEMCTVNLPIPTDFIINQDEQVSLQDLMNQFRNMVKRCEDFWEMMSEIDQNTWVLEPEKPSPSDCHRRLALGPSASLHIKVDAAQPRLLPQCSFLGADQVVAPSRERLNQNVHKWDVHCSLLENLQTVLETTLPSPKNSSREKFNLECGICYSYRLGEEIPDKVCDDRCCEQTFHHQCLCEWLRVLPSSRQSFNRIYGECPFCSKPITVKIDVSV
ncbi:E3 ubiquitin-protein ligase FANCL-like [Haliotis rufescens]|uniref:E3 ubiquitin-protein ligase FANCL-like n=1 Tax=Haliotis rufescens TaxID=6454 RepID=UPI00201FB2DD|nr:E3 ubiquitin-protein ligase FANCL-like [Haliotis rufescens]